MIKLSVVIITKNEELKIGSCLKSLLGLADEFIIVDDLSSDKTVEICKEFGAKIISSKSNGEFDKQRNIGIENANGEWILQLDADEIIPSESISKIRSAISEPKGFVGFEIRRKNFFLGKPILHSGNYGYTLKIFKKGAGYYIEKVHEKLKISGKIGKIDADINHYPFNSIFEVFERANFYTDIESAVFLKGIEKITEQRIKYELTIKSLRRFWKLYVKKQGYKDGMNGFIWCILNVIGPQMRWMKIWEQVEKKSRSIK